MIPKLLQPGSRIALAATARRVHPEDYQEFKNYIEHKGYEVVVAENLNLAKHQFAGDEKERASALQKLLDDDSVKAIIGIRGGYGTVRIIDQLSWEGFVESPKWICGFSDFTVLLNHVYQTFNIPTVHSDMSARFVSLGERENFDSLLTILENGFQKMEFHSTSSLDTVDKINGIVVGGNLSVLYSLLGSVSFPDLDGRILFLEDLDEYLYHLDRMMISFFRSGVLTGLKAIIVGGMTEMHDNIIPYGKDAESIIAEYAEKLGIPVFFQFPSGHQRINKPFFIGGEAQIITNGGKVSLTQKIMR